MTEDAAIDERAAAVERNPRVQRKIAEDAERMTTLPPSHLEAEATIQRLLAQQDGMAESPSTEWDDRRREHADTVGILVDLEDAEFEERPA